MQNVYIIHFYLCLEEIFEMMYTVGSIFYGGDSFG